MASSEQTVLQFGQSMAILSARVHPLIIFNISDYYVRRPDQAERVIGTLLGCVLPDGTVDIRNSYAVPHNESSDQVHLFLQFLATFFLCICFLVVGKIGINAYEVQAIGQVFFSLLYRGSIGLLPGSDTIEVSTSNGLLTHAI